MGRARQIASAENMDRILLDASAASTDEGEFLLLDASATGTDVGFFVNTEDGTGDAPPVISTAQLEDGAITSAKIAADAVTSAKIVDDAVTVAKMDSTSQSLSNRNVIINGAMNVAQRGTSSTGLGGNADSYHTVDRFKLLAEGSNSGRLTMTQDSSAPVGFANSTKLACTTADTSIAAAELLTLSQQIEGQNLQHFAKGTSSAKAYAVSFYVKGNASATYVCELFDNSNNRHVCKTFNVTTDFTRVELNFPADTTGTISDNNSEGLRLQIFLHAGSNFTSGTLPATWASKTNTNRAAGITSFFDSTDRTFFITGVQLEVGQEATEFEHEPFEKTLSKCQRYFISHTVDFSFHPGRVISSKRIDTGVPLPVEMRATPSLANGFSTSITGATCNTRDGNFTDILATSFSTEVSHGTKSIGGFRITNSNISQPAEGCCTNQIEGQIELSAEL